MAELETLARFDVFISHASEDKADVAFPIARRLEAHGLAVWIDALELTLGDSLRRSIERGLSQSNFGVVILSQAFFTKEWPARELDALFAYEDSGKKVILPIWHGVSREEVIGFAPLLAGKLAVSTARGLDVVADEIVRAIHASERRMITPAVQIDFAVQELSAVRQAVLAESSPWELRRHLYTLDDFLRRYPQHPEGRLLREQVLRAVMYAERRADAAESYSPGRVEYRGMARMTAVPGCFIILAILILLLLGLLSR